MGERDGPKIEIDGADKFVRDVWRLVDVEMPRELERVWATMGPVVADPIKEATPVGPDKIRRGVVVHEGGTLKNAFKWEATRKRVAWSYPGVPYGMRRHWGYRRPTRRLPEMSRRKRFQLTAEARAQRESFHRSLRWEPWAWNVLKEHEPLFHTLLADAWKRAQKHANWRTQSED